MIVFKTFSMAQKWANAFNSFPWFNLMVQAVPGGWTLTRASGVNNSVKA
ncbi:hypothetical protein MTsDn5_08150 [Alteromonas gracilis]